MGALDELRVVDFTRFLAGPFCTQTLADHGADVVRIEAPGAREFSAGPGQADTYFFLMTNRGKRSVVLDHNTEAGHDAITRLIEGADVVVENFRPGVMTHRGLDPDRFLVADPRLIWCSITGFGADGPYANRPGFDQIAQGMSGFMAVTGTDESGPTRAGIAIADLMGATSAVQGIMAAVIARHETGRGQRVDTSLLEAMVGIMSWSAGMYFETGEHPGAAGQHHPLSSPYGRFQAADGYLNIAAGSQPIWERLANGLGHPEWIVEDRFANPADRVRNRDLLTVEIEAVLASGTVEHWVEAINAAQVPCGPVLDLEQVFTDPQIAARDMVVELDHPERGPIRTTGIPVKLSATPGAIVRPPPLMGEHTEEVLREAGFTPEEIQRVSDPGA
ncbi:MAG: CoA transferase [Actinomycetia bacterium]|nr:CoA transferase [Actinomycetes bacterium]MCP3910437.1 CoA transferase [Actinomycetes bacterium]MCP4085499.1 CoA transferase [Actinomycetes bacterium]